MLSEHRPEVLHGEGLGEVVVHPRVEASGAVVRQCVGRHRDDRDARQAAPGFLRADPLRGSEAIELGLPEVEWEYDLAQRAAEVRGGRVVTRPLAEVVEELGLDG